MGRIIYGETNTKYVGIVLRVHNMFHTSVYNIVGHNVSVGWKIMCI